LLWQQHEDAAVYTSAGLSLHSGRSPTFSTATWLNQPVFVEVFNVSDSGEFMWSYASSDNQATFQVDMARHAEGYGTGSVDVAAALSDFVTPSNCWVGAFNSLGSGTPLWQWNMTNCVSSLLYDSDRFIDLSDDGSTLAFSAWTVQGKTNTAQLWVWDAQTGKLRFNKNLGTASDAGGPVQTSKNGTWIAWTSGDSVLIINGLTGAVRDTIQMGWNTQAQISDSGDYVTFAGEDTGYIYTWNAANQQYTVAYQPTVTGTWYSISCALSSDGSGTAENELVTFSWIDAEALTARATMYSMVNGQLLTDYTTPKNAQLQTSPTVRMDGNYAGLCLWGDNDDVPTAVVLQAGKSTPVFTYVTPGSMFGVDIVVDKAASTPTSDTIYFTVAGKHVPANVMGNGGDAYAWSIVNKK